VADPGLRHRSLARLAFVVNEPVRLSGSGTDLLPHSDFDVVPSASTPTFRRPWVHLISVSALPETCTPTPFMTLAERRVYLHLNRWTSPGLHHSSAMLLGLPVIVLIPQSSQRCPVHAGAAPATSTNSSPHDPSLRSPRRSVAG
jgi:hypothetical protein